MKAFWIQRPWFWWGYETEARGKFLCTIWLAQAEPPFFYGRALRIRINTRACYFGLCRKAKRPFVRSLDTSSEEIREWVYD